MSARRLAPFALLFALSACSSAASAPATADAGDLGDANDANDANDAAGEVADDAAPPPIAQPSVASVTFQLRNDAAEPRWIVTEGQFCDAWSIGGVPRTLGFQCICECPNPGGPTITAWRELAPGETYAVAWDGRGLATWRESVDCSQRGWPGAPPTTELMGVLQPAKAGTHVAWFGVATTAPQGCTALGDGTWTCPWSPGGGPGYPGSPPPAIQQQCSAPANVQATFDLPATGHVDVPVPLQ